MPERRTHWLRPNAAARMPRRLIVYDTESLQTHKQGSTEHRFRCGVASFDKLDKDARPEGEPAWIETESPLELWRWITSYTSHDHRTVAFAHNASFDVRVSDALTILPSLGFSCKGLALTAYSFWARYSDGNRSLWLCDSLSFLPASLERIADAVCLSKRALPNERGDTGEWLERCRGDCEITRCALLRLLAWFKDVDCGDFRQTGAAQAMACYRHRFLRKRMVLVHSEAEALAAERRAVCTGRAEVWRHGQVNDLVYEYDFTSAYAHLAQELELPCRLRGCHGPLEYERLERVMERFAVIADVTVRTDVPTVPTKHNDTVVWPVGEFKTTLWDHELRLAAEHGAKIEVERYWFYQRAPILREWATWILGLLDGDGAGADPLLRLTIKEWSRSLIGRFGLRYSELDEIAVLESSDVRLYGVHNADNGEHLTYLQLGHSLQEQMRPVEAPNSCPQVMGAIMSAARVRLWRAMQLAGLENLYYADTDGIIVSHEGRRRLTLCQSRGELPQLRHKAQFNGASFRSPRNIDLGEQRRINGAPRKSERINPSLYRGEVWESLPASLRRHRHDRVRVSDRHFHISDTDPRRLHLADGATAPLRLSLDPLTNASLVV